MIRRERPKGTAFPKVGVGEIDTSAPFQSVKDAAVNLFDEDAFSGEKPAIKQVKPHSVERVFVKETQLHLAEKDLNKLKEKLKNAENTKGEALVELEKARQTAKELTEKLKIINESKEVALKATESAKLEAKLLEAKRGSIAVNNMGQQQDLDRATKQYMNALAELNAAKQELTKIHQDYDALSEAKACASMKVEEAELEAKASSERTQEMSKEILDAKEAIEQLRQATSEAKQDLAKVFAEKDVHRQTYKDSLEELEKKLHAAQTEFDPELTENAETQMAQKMSEIHTLQKEMGNAKASDMETLRTVISELDGAKESLEKVLQEETALQQLVESLKCELEKLRKEHAELRKKEAETESVAGNLHVKLRKSKSKLEICLAEETKARVASDEMIATLNQLSSETENARLEAEGLKINAEELEKESEATRASLKEAEKLLGITLEQAEQAKAAEESAFEQIKILSERTNTVRSSMSELGTKITLLKDEFESLSRKAEESDKLAELKVAATLTQVTAIKASESEALMRLEAAQKEMEDIKTATQETLKRAETAEAAKKAVEGKLRRWREREQKKVPEAASRILAGTQEAQACAEGGMTETTHRARAKYSPIHYKIQKQKSDISIPTKNLEKRQNSLSKKAVMPKLGGIFYRKKSQIDTRTPSYLPGENPF